MPAVSATMVSLTTPRRFARDCADDLHAIAPVVVGIDAREAVGEHLMTALIGRAPRSPANPDRWPVGLRGFDDDGTGPEAEYRPLVRTLRRMLRSRRGNPGFDVLGQTQRRLHVRKNGASNASMVAPATAHLDTDHSQTVGGETRERHRRAT